MNQSSQNQSHKHTRERLGRGDSRAKPQAPAKLAAPHICSGNRDRVWLLMCLKRSTFSLLKGGVQSLLLGSFTMCSSFPRILGSVRRDLRKQITRNTMHLLKSFAVHSLSAMSTVHRHGCCGNSAMATLRFPESLAKLCS